MIALNYSQTFLITAAVKFLEIPASQRDMNHAYGFIGATALIYMGPIALAPVVLTAITAGINTVLARLQGRCAGSGSEPCRGGLD
jgi:hypothetical protein